MIDHAAFESAARRVEADANKAGWDQPPRLFGIVPTGDTLEVPDFRELVGADGRPVDGMLALARLGRRLQYAVPRELWPLPQLIGWVLTHEGWLVQNREHTEAAAAGLLAQAFQRQLHEHPDRLETRMAHLVARNGIKLTLIRIRGSENVLPFPEYVATILSAEGAEEAVGDQGWMSGDVMAALDTLMAHTPGPRAT